MYILLDLHMTILSLSIQYALLRVCIPRALEPRYRARARRFPLELASDFN